MRPSGKDAVKLSTGAGGFPEAVTSLRDRWLLNTCEANDLLCRVGVALTACPRRVLSTIEAVEVPAAKLRNDRSMVGARGCAPVTVVTTPNPCKLAATLSAEGSIETPPSTSMCCCADNGTATPSGDSSFPSELTTTL